MGLKVLKGSLDIGEVDILQEVGFPCGGETTFIKISPWWTTSRFVPVPSIVSLVIPLIITSSFEESALPLRSGLEAGCVAWVRQSGVEVLIGSPSLAINIWFPRSILPRRVWSDRGLVVSPATSGDCLHSVGIGLLEVPSVHLVRFCTLLCGEQGVFFEGGGEEAEGITHRGALCCEV